MIKVVFVGKYLMIPESEIKILNHDYMNDILEIELKNNQKITITNFDFFDFNKIEYKQIEDILRGENNE